MTATDPILSPRHPIAVVAERTGLSPDVLRAWERRYHLVHPARGAAGQRLYSDADVERLSLLHHATSAGRSIGQIAALPIEDIRSMVAEDSAARDASAKRTAGSASAPGSLDTYIVPAMTAIAALDAPKLESILRRAVGVLGIPAFVESVAAPLCHRIGDDWHAGNITVAQEHLATAALQNVVSTAIASMSTPVDAPVIVIGTPSGERHAMGALLAAATATVSGWRVIYLGADLPASEFAGAARSSGARAVALSVVFVNDRAAVIAQLKSVKAVLPSGTQLIAGGAAAQTMEADLKQMGIVLSSDSNTFRSELESLAGYVSQ